MERSEILTTMAELKLYGMKAAYEYPSAEGRLGLSLLPP
jgi:hypothetical protein